MANFFGTIGTDTFIGTDNVQDVFYFSDTTLDGSDIVEAGHGFETDVMYLTAGTYDAAMFAGVDGIDAIRLNNNAGTTLTIDDALSSQGGVAADDGRLLILTSSGNDTVDASGVTTDGVHFDHGGGADVIYGSQADDVIDAAVGGSTLSFLSFFGNDGNDVVNTGVGQSAAGIQYLDGGDGVDELHFVSGNDVRLDLNAAGTQFDIDGALLGVVTNFESYHADGVSAVMLGDSGDNEFHGSAFSDTLHGRAGDDILRGGDGDDILGGGAGDDTLDGGIGNDIIFGGFGNDTLDYSEATNDMDIDLAAHTATDGVERFHAFLGIEGAIGGSGDDTLSGDNRDNMLAGSGGDDTLFGQDGDDILLGMSGSNEVHGGAGADDFFFIDIGNGYGNDTIADFEDGSDVLHFVGVDSVQVADVGADAVVTMLDQYGVSIGSVTATGAAGLVDSADYVLWS